MDNCRRQPTTDCRLASCLVTNISSSLVLHCFPPANIKLIMYHNYVVENNTKTKHRCQSVLQTPVSCLLSCCVNCCIVRFKSKLTNSSAVVLPLANIVILQSFHSDSNRLTPSRLSASLDSSRSEATHCVTNSI